MALSEIATMRKFKQVIDANKASQLTQEMNYDPIPNVLDYGLVRLEDFAKSQTDDVLATHYVMPLYEMDMKKYLKKL